MSYKTQLFPNLTKQCLEIPKRSFLVHQNKKKFQTIVEPKLTKKCLTKPVSSSTQTMPYKTKQQFPNRPIQCLTKPNNSFLIDQYNA